ncbi:hypothetical protein [Kitasatospora griseola]|uniref:hypothetical protein n=1 Tax=Kitasatospora griseola TaxID=2064 RepID=UPI003420F07E
MSESRNEISGSVSGPVVQAGTVKGNVTVVHGDYVGGNVIGDIHGDFVGTVVHGDYTVGGKARKSGRKK